MNIYSIGESIQGRPMLAVEFYSEEFDEFGQQPNPEVRLMGNIHGNEDQGIFILLPLIKDLATESENKIASDRMRLLTENVRVHILISANPDGYIAAQISAS